jgi:hypothetical protein
MIAIKLTRGQFFAFVYRFTLHQTSPGQGGLGAPILPVEKNSEIEGGARLRS